MRDALEDLAEAARRLMPPGCYLAATDPRKAWPLLPGEDVTGMVEKRAREFSAGRQAARRAIAQLPAPHPEDVTLLKGADRAPVWPAGITGSISHSASACLALVTRNFAGVGLDLEPDQPLDPALARLIRNPSDEVQFWPRAKEALLLFCAKEAAYKAQYALSRRVFGFEVIGVSIKGDHFTARFLEEIAPFGKGASITGRIAAAEDHLLALAWI